MTSQYEKDFGDRDFHRFQNLGSKLKGMPTRESRDNSRSQMGKPSIAESDPFVHQLDLICAELPEISQIVDSYNRSEFDDIHDCYLQNAETFLHLYTLLRQNFTKEEIDENIFH